MPSTPPQPNDHPTRLAKIFLNREGLRPIWSIALFLAIWALLNQIIIPLSQALFPTTSSHDHFIPARTEYIFESASLLCVAIATAIMAALESRPLTAYGLNPHHSLRNFAAGLTSGTTLLSLLVFFLYKSDLLTFDSRLLFGPQILHCAAIWAIGFLLVALAEETLLRGYLQFTLTRALTPITRRLTPAYSDRTAFWAAALILSIAFGAIHLGNPGESPIGLVAASLVGLIFCLSLWRTGSLWWAIGFHAAWDWSQSFLYGVADSGLLVRGHLFATHPSGRTVLSGGLTGPEGSALILPILVLACAAALLAPASQTSSS